MNIISPESVGFSSNRLSRVNRFMQSYIDKGKLASGMTMLARRGEVFHFQPYGVLDLESGVPVERDTIFRFYSMTKPITSVAVMMLYEEGHFSLDDTVGKFIPELASMKVFDGMGETGMRFVDQERPITIRHLLTHTAGLSYGFHQDSPVETMYRAADVTNPDSNLQEMAEKLGSLPLVNQPGTKWRYSVATDVLGYFVQVVSGQPFDEFLRERILTPLGMPDTAFYAPEEKLHESPPCTPRGTEASRPRTMFLSAGSPGLTPSFQAAAGWCPRRQTTCASAKCCSTAASSATRACSRPRPWR